MTEFLKESINILIYLIAIKAMIIGSNFSFIKWYKYGKHYLKWYKIIGKIKFVG